MPIFGKLFSQKASKSDHPLGSDENVAALLAGIPAHDPARILQETGEWFDDFERFATEIGPAALLHAALRLDDLARPARLALTERYLDPARREHLSDVVWIDIERSTRRVIAACHLCLKTAALDPALQAPDSSLRHDMLLASARALRTWAERKKLLRFRYRGPEAADWREAHALLALAGKLGFAGEEVLAYDTEAEKLSPLQNYLVAIYLELSPLANLSAAQIESLDRVLLESAKSLDLLTTAGVSSTHMIDISGAAGPVKIETSAPADGQWRYLSRSRLRPLVTKLAMKLRQDSVLPEKLQSCGLSLDQLHRLLTMLMLHWADVPPYRISERRPGNEPLMAVMGFPLSRRAVAFSDFARSGKSVDYVGTDHVAEFETARFGGMVTTPGAGAAPETAPAAAIVNPLDVLGSLELAGDKQMMEPWTLTDQSDTGLGAAVPGLKSRYQVGHLACVRYADGIEWHLGIIRRIGRDKAGSVSIGLQTLAWPSSSVHVKPVAGSMTAWNTLEHAGHGYVDAILVSLDGDQLVLPRGFFMADLALELRGGDRRQVRLTELIERGPDFELVRFVATG